MFVILPCVYIFWSPLLYCATRSITLFCPKSFHCRYLFGIVAISRFHELHWFLYYVCMFIYLCHVSTVWSPVRLATTAVEATGDVSREKNRISLSCSYNSIIPEYNNSTILHYTLLQCYNTTIELYYNTTMLQQYTTLYCNTTTINYSLLQCYNNTKLLYSNVTIVNTAMLHYSNTTLLPC